MSADMLVSQDDTADEYARYEYARDGLTVSL
jgi:hypothetical protein